MYETTQTAIKTLQTTHKFTQAAKLFCYARTAALGCAAASLIVGGIRTAKGLRK